MKLILPYVDRALEADIRLAQLAAFAGIATETVQLKPGSSLSAAIPSEAGCVVLNPRVLRQWAGALSSATVDEVLSRAPFILIHGIEPGQFDSEVIRVFSNGALREVETAKGRCQVEPETSDICEAFAGLTIGPAVEGNDSILTRGVPDEGLRPLITFGGHPFLATLKRPQGEILFLASADVADLQGETSDAALPIFFSRFVPYLMALRHAFGKQCWRPAERHASVVIDDPLLKKRHGFLDFETLRAMTEKHHFHTVIAFIPHNFRRSSRQIVRMFHENRAALSLCFHGNDHTNAEFAAADPTHLNTLLAIAQERMAVHQRLTGLPCERVMVFPQGKFSVQAMSVLKANNFLAAVNTVPHPYGQPTGLTLAELAQPAVLRYAGFPLFLRKPIRETRDYDVAFCLMFGRPVLIVEHHDLFRNPDPLGEIAQTINSVAPDIAWSDLATLVRGSYLLRETPNGSREIRAYAMAVNVANSSQTGENVTITWDHGAQGHPLEGAWDGDMPLEPGEVGPSGVRLAAGLPPQSTREISLTHQNTHPVNELGFKRWVNAVARRRLSEWRDNYISRSPRALAMAKVLRSRLIPGV